MKKTYWLLFGIVVIAAILRFYQLGTNPPSLTWDEAAWGYNAYSVGIDGRDEFGRFLPYDYLESFGDFKPPMYAYLDTLPVKIIGLTEFATRFPSALFGVLTVFISYFLVKQMFFKAKYREQYALLTSAILAISPWHIMLSRAAFEANVATFFVVCGVWLFLKAVQENMWYLSLSAMFFVASFYTFNTPRVAVPILVILLTILFYKKLLKFKKQTFVGVIVGVLLLLPIVHFLLSPQASLRFQEVNIFSDVNVVKTSNQEITNDNNAQWSKIIHNRRLIYGVDFLQHYFDEFNPNFLFISGDVNPKFSTHDTGELYLVYIPFLLIGAFLLFKRKESNWWLVIIWLLVGIIPAATARETPHALRTEVVLPTFDIIIAYGIFQSYLFMQQIRYKWFYQAVTVVFFITLAFNFIKFQHGYYAHYARENSVEWQYGYKESIAYVQSVKNQYDQVNVTDTLGRPYIYYLFYMKVDPRYYRQHVSISRDGFGFVTVKSFDKLHFSTNVQKIAAKDKTNLFIDDPRNVPKNAIVLKTFYNLDNTPALVAYTL